MCSCESPDHETRIDSAILSMLLNEPAQRPWAVEEVVREIGDSLAVADSLARLYGAGLIHRLEGFVFPTRPAVQGGRLDL